MNRKTVISVSIALAIFLSGNPALAQELQGTANETWRGRPLVLDPRCTRTIEPLDPIRMETSRVFRPGSLIASRVAQSRTRPIRPEAK